MILLMVFSRENCVSFYFEDKCIALLYVIDYRLCLLYGSLLRDSYVKFIVFHCRTGLGAMGVGSKGKSLLNIMR